MDISKIDLNAPAFGEGAAKIEEVQETESIVAESEPKAETESVSVEPEPEVKKEEEIVEPSVEETKVPYSRFKTIHQRAIEAERELRELHARDELSKPSAEEESSSSNLPDWWTKLYGDSDLSREGWNSQQNHFEKMKEEAREEALRAVREESAKEAQLQNENLKKIEEQFEDLSAFVGRNLTEKEQSSLLDIVDDYTPKGDDGRYLGAILPFDKAWEIYELKNQVAKAPTQKSRDAVASLTSSKTQGEPSAIEERNKDFNPSWGALGEVLRNIK